MKVETTAPGRARSRAVRWATPDPVLLGALALGLAFCLYGIHWGVTEPWNPDQVAFYDAIKDGHLTWHPGDFLKPPFHKYLSLILARIPAYAVSKLLGLSDVTLREVTLLCARTLTLFLFLAQIVLIYTITRRFFGQFAARILAIVYATSAGVIAFSHFLTADIPVTTWMLVAFYFAQNVLLRGRLSDYVLAGAFTGIATATKYNGLAIGITFVVGHALAADWLSWRGIVLDRRLILGLAAVPLAFIIVNPFSVLDMTIFINDFMYNLVTTPVYGGKIGGHNYLSYWSCVIEIIGLPAFVLLVPAVIGGTWFGLRHGSDNLASQGLLILLAVSLLYYAYFGSFARLPTRFVLPVVPYFMMLAGPAFERLGSNARVVATVVGSIVLYNAACSAVVGWQFVNDPRMAVRPWMRENLPAGAVVAYSMFAPRPDLIEDAGFVRVRMPVVTSRRKIFSELFANNRWVRRNLDRFEESDVNWYSPASLAKRSPDVLVVDSIYFNLFLSEQRSDETDTKIRAFFTDLLGGRLGYHIVFDRTSRDGPVWAYPGTIDFLHNRIVVLERSGTG
jgi:4-amino-4-deoxy-L-arabinose transferase-like glycosyltransferase